VQWIGQYDRLEGVWSSAAHAMMAAGRTATTSPGSSLGSSIFRCMGRSRLSARHGPITWRSDLTSRCGAALSTSRSSRCVRGRIVGWRVSLAADRRSAEAFERPTMNAAAQELTVFRITVTAARTTLQVLHPQVRRGGDHCRPSAAAFLPLEVNGGESCTRLQRPRSQQEGCDPASPHRPARKQWSRTRVSLPASSIPCSSPANGEISIGCGGAVAPVG
jgi:hypothetical protein